ncbi:hypothetical protein JCM10449v2_003852 [Rhodotorula kratochvilovae]
MLAPFAPATRRARTAATAALAWTTLAVVPLVLAQSVPSALFSDDAVNKVRQLAQSSQTPSQWPEYTDGAGAWVLQPETDWTSAFFPSALYSLHHRFTALCPDDGDGTDWLALARAWSAALYNPSQEVLASWTHDVGFNTQPAIEELRLDPANATARTSLLSNAAVLASRFSSVVGCTRSWDRGEDDFKVIIDNMMNLPLLLEAAELTGDTTYRSMATSHANRTRGTHIREDGSSFHVVDYSPTTGDVLWGGTAQGYSNSSTWTRGHTWGTLGFALMYNATGFATYLDTSRQMAAFFLANLPSSGVSPWDFSAPSPATLDSSASLILSSALLVLSSLEASQGNSSGAAHWSDAAIKLLGNVVNVAVEPWTGASIVGNATVNNRANPYVA